MTSSYASKLVTRLEERLGVPLLLRTTRRLTLTEAGRAYFECCVGVLQGLEEAEAAATALQSTLTGTLRVTLPSGLGMRPVLESISEFMAENPKLALDLAFLDRQVDLAGEGYDVAIRVGRVGDPSLIARKLADTAQVLVASPAYLERAGALDSPEDLSTHQCLLYAYHSAPGVWRLRGPEGVREVKVSGRMVANHGQMLVEAATKGHGIIFVPAFRAAKAVRAGRLVRVLPAWSWPVGIYAMYLPTPRVPHKVRAFVDFMLARFREEA